MAQSYRAASEVQNLYMRIPYAHRLDIYQQTGGDRHASRSAVYAWHRSLSLLGELNRRGIVGDDGRDATTGRKVSTIVLELSRVLERDQDAASEWPAGLADRLVETYVVLRDKPLDEVRRICRDARA